MTSLALGRTARGRIDSGDEADLYVLEWSQPASVAIYTTGSLDTVGSLLDESRVEIASDDDGGDGLNFHIEGERAAGVYLVRVDSFGSATGSYTLHARRYVDVDLGETGDEAVRLWATAVGGWTLDPATGEPFASGGQVVASNGDTYVLELGTDGMWIARTAAGSCQADLGWTTGTLAGTGVQGYSGDGGPATAAQLSALSGVTTDSEGNVYVADWSNHRIRRISPDGAIETIAGTGQGDYGGDGGLATDAHLRYPRGVAVDAAGNVYITDTGNHRVRRIGPGGTIATIAGTGTAGYGGDGGQATDAQLDSPYGVAVDAAGYVYISETANHRIRRIAPNGTIETYAGTGEAGGGGDGGPATAARLAYPHGLALDRAGNVYVADRDNHAVRRIAPDGTIETIAGTGQRGYGGDGGPATAAQFNDPLDVAVDAAGNVYVADTANHRIRRIGSGGAISTFAGTGNGGYGGDDGPATSARLNLPYGVAVNAAGYVFIADTGNYRVRVLQPSDDHGDDAECATPLTLGAPVQGRVETGDDADWFQLQLSGPASVAIYTTGDLDTVGSLRDETDAEIASNDDGGEGRNFHIEGDRPTGVYFVRVASFGSGTGRYTLHVRRYADVALGSTQESVRLWATADGAWTLDGEPFLTGGDITASNGDRFVLTLGADGVWTATVANPTAGSCEAGLTWTIRTLAITGASGFSFPGGVAVDTAGNVYFIDGSQIRRIAPDGTIETYAGTGLAGYGGDGGPATRAQIYATHGVAADAAGYVYIGDGLNRRVRRIAPDGTIETIAGNGNRGSGVTAVRLPMPNSGTPWAWRWTRRGMSTSPTTATTVSGGLPRTGRSKHTRARARRGIQATAVRQPKPKSIGPQAWRWTRQDSCISPTRATNGSAGSTRTASSTLSRAPVSQAMRATAVPLSKPNSIFPST